MKHAKWLRRIGTSLIAAFTALVLLDSFVIERGYTAAESAESVLFPAAAAKQESAAQKSLTPLAASCAAEEEEESGSLVLPADAKLLGEYTAADVTIKLYTFRRDDTQIYAADVCLGSVRSLKTAFADGVYGRNVTDKTSSIAAEAGAALAINGDFYGARESGLVIRNGVLYRASAAEGELLVIYADGRFAILSAEETSAEELLADGAWQVLSFGPGLVENGEVSVSAGEEVGRAMASNPRTAIGQIGEGEYLFLVSDGRTDESRGLSLKQLAALLAELGCREAYNLDGGGSSTMVFLGEVVNKPTTNGRKISERSVSDIVYVG